MSEQNKETGNRIVHFAQRTVKENGEYMACLTEEGADGYWKTDWPLGKDYGEAVRICDERNEERGISKVDAEMIILQTMGNCRRKNS